MSNDPISEAWLKKRVWPRFSRTRKEHRRIHLASHAFGRPPDRMAQDVQHALDLWYHDMEGAWSEWLAARERFRALIARLIGAKRPDCVVPKASAGQGLRAVLNALQDEKKGKLRVVTSDGEFDSIDFILRVYREQGRIDLRVMPWRELSLGNADLVVLSSVQFRTGEWISNLPKFMRAAKTAGALVLLDVYHHAGVLPLDVAALGADFAIGGCAKYLRGGPGAGWLYVRPGLAETLRTPDTGWFAKDKPFTHERPEPPQFAAGGDAWLESTPAVLAPIQALAGLELTLEMGVDRLRDYSIEQKQLLADFLNLRGVPSEGAGDEHGAFLTVQHEDPLRLAAALARHHIVTDTAGDRLRLTPDILNTESELAQVAEELGALLARR
ncbi:MAG TPA: aminotransferase class V-fold PLP-dependent enzyme [Burkholderiales bacterium]|nr:aminotransferase class V-fold PLP-dependent enzyme [Burkholderiales bacterium]